MRFELAHDELQLRYLFRVGLADYDRGIDRRDCRAHVVRKFDRAGTIDEVIIVAEELRRSEVYFDAHFVRTRFRAGIADRSACIDATCTRNRARAGENRFKQRGFSGLKRTDDRNRARSATTYAVGIGVRRNGFLVSHRHLPARIPHVAKIAPRRNRVFRSREDDREIIVSADGDQRKPDSLCAAMRVQNRV